MTLNEKFEVEFKDKYSSQQKSLLLNAIKDLYLNLESYEIIERNDSSKDQTLRFMDYNYISKNEISDLIEHYAFNLNVCEWGDILKDRDRKNNLLYILYIPNAKIGNWDSSKSKEKLLYIKWNPKNKKILSFHTMKKIHDTNRDDLMEKRMRFVEDKFEIYNTHDKYKYINRWCNLYYDKVSENLFILYDGYIEIVNQMKFSEFERIYDEYTLCKSTDKIVQIWKKDRKLEEKLSFAQLKSEVVPQSKANQNLNYFYKQRNKLNGQGNRNIKFVTSQFDPNDGSILFMYRTDATYNGEDKKELVNDDINDGELRKNISDEYDIQLKICDFWDILDELISPTDDNFTKEDMKAILELSQEIRISCSCPSQYWTGSDFYLTQIDAQLKKCTISPKWWNQPHLRPNVLVCKHLLSLLNHISFFLPNMAMSCKKELKDFGLI